MRTLRIIRGIVKFDKDAFALAWWHVWERFKSAIDARRGSR
jgi:hypothetical protein